MSFHGAIVNTNLGIARDRPLVNVSPTAHAGAGPRYSSAALAQLETTVANGKADNSALIWVISGAAIFWIFLVK